jgi:hypothetical protein
MPGGLAAAKPGVSAPASSAGTAAPVSTNAARANGPSEPASRDSQAKAAIGVGAKETGTATPLPQVEAASGQPAFDSAAGMAAEVSGDRGAVSAPTIEVPRALNLPKRSPTAITITAPTDGLRLGPDDPPVVVVQGDVEDPSTTLVSLIVNGRRVRVPVADRRFHHVVPVLEPTVRLRAEGTTGDPPGQSSTITVHGAQSAAPALVLVLDGPMPASSFVDVRATWRSSAARVDIPAFPVALKSVAPGPAMPSAVFYTRNLQSGVYTLALRPEPGAGLPAVGTLYVLRDGQLSVRTLNIAPVNGSRRVLARLLMPYGVLWDQEDWFTGRSQNAETVTKFRFPDGVSWIERKADLAP